MLTHPAVHSQISLMKIIYLEKKVKPLLTNKSAFWGLLGFWCIGLLMAFTPCVLPLLIMMVSCLGKQTGLHSRSTSIGLTLTYVCSLSITYAIAGIIAALFGFYVQRFFQQTWIVITFSLLFVLLALSQFGFYKLQLPATLRHRIIRHNKLQENYSYLQAALMGSLATLIAAPCAGAPLIGVLSYVGENGNALYASVALFFVGLGIGTPLLLVVIIGHKILPTAPKLQDGIKALFGIMLMGVAIWLVSSITPPMLNMTLWAILIVYAAILLFNLFKNENNFSRKIGRLLSLPIFTFGFAVFVSGLVGGIDPLLPFSFNSQTEMNATLNQFKKITTENEFKLAIIAAKKQQKPVMLIFSASWCVVCKEMDKLYALPDLKPILSQFILLRIDISNSDNLQLAKKFNVIAPPAALFFNHNGDELEYRLDSDVDETQLAAVLLQILAYDQLL